MEKEPVGPERRDLIADLRRQSYDLESILDRDYSIFPFEPESRLGVRDAKAQPHTPKAVLCADSEH